MAKHSSEARTETLILDLLTIQGWATGRSPHGCIVRQNEYKAFLELEEIFKGKSKRGKGDGYPDFLVVSKETNRPQMVIEAKADEAEFEKALEEAIHYGEACREAGHPVIAVGVAGQERTKIRLGVAKYYQGEWKRVAYSGNLISWLPTRHSLLAVCQMPDELFQPYASATTSVVLLEKGIPHNPRRKTVFTRIEYDGFTLRKGIRVARQDEKNQCMPDLERWVSDQFEKWKKITEAAIASYTS